VQDDLLGPLASKLELSLEEIDEFFLSGPYYRMFIGFAFEEYATVMWDEADQGALKSGHTALNELNPGSK
tara:strand:- start:1902 stop:2111 length:210 start_codon:yes stop_codon:yes gene_type:complete